ncbi:hypothetical protein EPUL_003860 [Erysiphe pulchra]|uniref:Protein root UVB sensitive/RUS domain-containing protein n=1 Tax=Erysiphe pulchra TaxID=225359 RepID=A0A2S4PMS8_9PEZI|nr:hypothetical protein EPUL_003860 [Erysiphe pulchra]
MPQKISNHQQSSMYEFDRVGNDVARYIQSTSEDKYRIDVIVSPKTKNFDYVKNVIEVFLPVGFPGSVTADYLPVSPTSAILLSVLQDSMGRLATVSFAHRLGTSIEPECKMYRYAADIFNDSAMILDCLSPIFPRLWRLPFWCLSSALRSMCGVAAGSSKASLSAHFATQGNLGELNAKDSSQETVISLMGMLSGSLLLPYISSQKITWFIIRKEYSYGSLRSSIWHLDLPSPSDISQKERIFELDGVLRWKNSSALGYCKLGVSLKSILDCFGCSNIKTGSYSNLHSHQFQQLLNIYKDSGYILFYNKSQRTYLVAIKSHMKSEVEVHLKAWIQALCLAKFGLGSDDQGSKSASLTKAYQHTCKFADHLVDGVISSPSFAKLGWNLETSAMETIPGTRFLERLMMDET